MKRLTQSSVQHSVAAPLCALHGKLDQAMRAGLVRSLAEDGPAKAVVELDVAFARRLLFSIQWCVMDLEETTPIPICMMEQVFRERNEWQHQREDEEEEYEDE